MRFLPIFFLFLACNRTVADPELETNGLHLRQSTHWEASGFFNITVPVSPPSYGWDKVDIWVRIPEGALITLKNGELSFPIGTQADRVERWKNKSGMWHVADVRGTTIVSDAPFSQQQHHVYRPYNHPRLQSPPSHDLFGIEWTPSTERDAHNVLLKRMEQGWGFSQGSRGWHSPMASAQQFKTLLNCASCHSENAQENLDSTSVKRGTDASAFYSFKYLFRNDTPKEQYRPKPFSSPYVTEVSGILVYDLNSALKANDPHAKAVCNSRRHVFDRMNDDARSVTTSAMEECDNL